MQYYLIYNKYYIQLYIIYLIYTNNYIYYVHKHNIVI